MIKNSAKEHKEKDLKILDGIYKYIIRTYDDDKA